MAANGDSPRSVRAFFSASLVSAGAPWMIRVPSDLSGGEWTASWGVAVVWASAAAAAGANAAKASSRRDHGRPWKVWEVMLSLREENGTTSRRLPAGFPGTAV